MLTHSKAYPIIIPGCLYRIALTLIHVIGKVRGRMGNDNVWTFVDGQRVATLAQLVSTGSKKGMPHFSLNNHYTYIVQIAAPFSPLPPTNPSTHAIASPMPWLGLSNPCQNVSVQQPAVVV